VHKLKLLCVADQIDPVVYSSAVKERFKDIDGVLCAGDLPMDYIDFIVSTLNKPTFFIFGNHNLKEFSYYHRSPALSTSSTFSAGKEPFVSAAVLPPGHGADYVGFKVLRAKKLTFTDPLTHKTTPLLIAGASGSLRYNNGINQYSDREMFFRLVRMWPQLFINKLKYGRYLDIFLTHAAPRHIHDLEDQCHKGFECFNWFIKKFKPEWFIHGHIHLYDSRTERLSTSGSTKIVNAYGYYIIEIPLKQE
jgi:uncharacterized protein